MRLRHKPWASSLLSQHRDIALNESDLLSLPSFDRLEIGSGCGGFLIKMASKNPSHVYLGAEVASTAFAIAVKKLTEQEKKPTNLKFINCPVEKLMPLVKPGSVGVIYLNFSDPWPKTRHHKRRLTYPTRLDEYYAALLKGGKLFFKTDNDGLYEDSKKYFLSEGKFVCTFIDDYQTEDPEDEESEYEEKFRTKGVTIHRIVAIKE
jgi:tRNA (guanine-N7-)-methyltransferase